MVLMLDETQTNWLMLKVTMPPCPSLIAITTPSVLHIQVIITREVAANIKNKAPTVLDLLVEGR